MDPFTYLSVLISIVLALGMTRVLLGVGEMLQARHRVHFHWIQSLWTLNLFLYLVIAWWIFYRWRFQPHWPFFLFLFVLISPTLLYLAAVVLFPSECPPGEHGHDYGEHFFRNHRVFFTVFGLFVPVDVVDTLLKGHAHFLALGPKYIISSAILFILFAVAAITPSKRYHAFFAIYALLHTLVMSDVLYYNLRSGI
ncbi:MAG: hypothetical protein JO354_03710 [Verrucomicrobia bacterium]|nr:hypothetical protein [Verrucomicrobiota bacterium]